MSVRNWASFALALWTSCSVLTSQDSESVSAQFLLGPFPLTLQASSMVEGRGPFRPEDEWSWTRRGCARSYGLSSPSDIDRGEQARLANFEEELTYMINVLSLGSGMCRRLATTTLRIYGENHMPLYMAHSPAGQTCSPCR